MRAESSGSSNYGSRRCVLAAPDSFKGTFSAPAVSGSMARGVLEAGRDPPFDVDECPVADGGEGTAEVLMEAIGGQEVPAPATDPLGKEITAGFTLLGNGEMAVVETAAASGFSLVDEAERDAVAASSAGTGHLILAAARAGARKILVAVGGTATSDGGQGAIETIEEGGGPGEAKLVVLADVDAAFEDAATVFGPQKGATPDQVDHLTRGLEDMAGRLPRSPLGIARTGAGGGIAGGLWARFNAEVVSGADYVLDAIDFDQRLDRCDRVLTGEGQLDHQTLAGKIVGQVLQRARKAGRPCHAITGRNRLDDQQIEKAGFTSVQTASTLEEIKIAARRAVAGL